jgi:predicted PurR-regulated permease PerM
MASTTRFHRPFVLLLLLVTAGAFIVMVRDLLLAIILAAILSGLLHPLFVRTCGLLGGRKAPSAAAVIVLMVLAVGLPVAGIVTVVVAEALEVSGTVGPYVSQALAEGVLPAALPDWARALEPYQSEIVAGMGRIAESLTGGAVESLTRATQGTALVVLNLGVFLYALFFFLKDGPAWLDAAVGYLPLEASARSIILEKGLSITRATLLSILVVGTIQGILVGLAFWAAGIPGAAFWGAVVIPASAIPGLGAALVWVPGVVYLIIDGRLGWAMAVALWGAAIVGLVDNVLRAWLIGVTTRMSDLLVFVATLGGIATLGPVGIIIGPVLAGLLLTVLDIYRDAFREMLTGPDSP